MKDAGLPEHPRLDIETATCPVMALQLIAKTVHSFFTCIFKPKEQCGVRSVTVSSSLYTHLYKTGLNTAEDPLILQSGRN